MTRILDQGAQENYLRGVGKEPRARGIPYNLKNPDRSIAIAEKFWSEIQARRIFA